MQRSGPAGGLGNRALFTQLWGTPVTNLALGFLELNVASRHLADAPKTHDFVQVW